MKPSKYNIYVKENKRHFIYNQLTGCLTEFDRELFDAIKNNQKLEGLSVNIIEELKQNNYICDQDLNECTLFYKEESLCALWKPNG